MRSCYLACLTFSHCISKKIIQGSVKELACVKVLITLKLFEFRHATVSISTHQQQCVVALFLVNKETDFGQPYFYVVKHCSLSIALARKPCVTNHAHDIKKY